MQESKPLKGKKDGFNKGLFYRPPNVYKWWKVSSSCAPKFPHLRGVPSHMWGFQVLARVCKSHSPIVGKYKLVSSYKAISMLPNNSLHTSEPWRWH